MCIRDSRHIEVLGFGSNFTIYDADDQKTVMKEIFRKFDINTKIYKERGVLAEISHAKDEMITPEEMELNAGGDPDARKIAGMYKEYQDVYKRQACGSVGSMPHFFLWEKISEEMRLSLIHI